MEYVSYLRTDHWKNTRQEKLVSRGVCQICTSNKNLHVHHKHYSHNGQSILFHERIQDLITLCGSCHSLWHRYIKELRKPNKKILRIRRLMKLGVMKNKAFWLVGNPETYESIYQLALSKTNSVWHTLNRPQPLPSSTSSTGTPAVCTPPNPPLSCSAAPVPNTPQPSTTTLNTF